MNKQNKILVWDIPTRIAHWMLVVLIAYAWFAVEILEDMEQHFWAGYGLLGVILFRLIWGLVGSFHARFSNFLATPKTVWSYAKSLPRPDSKVYLGHNPIGGWSAFLMILVLLVQASTGLFNSDDYFHGPLSGLVSDATRATLGEIHELNFDLACVLIALHLLAIGVYKFYKRQNLIAAMFTGKKPAVSGGRAIAGSKLLLALAVVFVCLAVVYYLATGFSDTLPSGEFDYSF